MSPFWVERINFPIHIYEAAKLKEEQEEAEKAAKARRWLWSHVLHVEVSRQGVTPSLALLILKELHWGVSMRLWGC